MREGVLKIIKDAEQETADKVRAALCATPLKHCMSDLQHASGPLTPVLGWYSPPESNAGGGAFTV